MSALYFDARIDGTQLQKDIANINKQIGQISTNMQKEGREIDDISGRIGRGLAGAFSVFAAGNFIKDMAKVRGEFQQLEVAFETMLGSRERADKLMAEVVQFAAKTPFELSDVASGTKQLLAFGIEAEKVIPTLKAMGDVSAGLSVPIERLINNFGQVKTQMKLTGRELRDFQMAGVPVVAELAKNLNTSEKAIGDMVTAGKIGFAEVEQAFISMTSEGGRFSSLMEKQAETITGLASNFADAWDRMLNSIGKENEGIIAGSIQGAITLVENYEEVVKILKLLIATYGTYKAAVIATAVVERTAAAAGNIKAWFELARGIRTAKDAQLAFNIASKANPYALIAGAIASLISYLVIFRKETKSTQDYIEDLNTSIESIGRQIEVDNLISKYVELKDKTGLTKDEQSELNTTIAELSKIFPSVISQTDSYGRAIDLTREKVVQLNDELRENTRLTTEKQVTDAQDELNQKIAERARLLKEANQGFVETFVEYSTGARMPIMVELVPKAIEERRKRVEELNNEINNLTNSISDSESKLRQLGEIDAAQALAPYRDLFGEVEKYSEQQALKIKEELTKLLFLGFGAEAEQKIKAEIDKIASQLALPTVQEQIQQVLSDLQTAQSQLGKLRAPGSRATTDQIKDKQDEIKALQEKYDALTGINRKEAEKRQEEQRKAELERLKALAEFNREELTLERQLQASRIALMQQGAERQKAEAEFIYQQELDRIEQQQQEYLKAWNASKGFEPGDVGFISELPDAEIEKFIQLRINAEEKKNQQIIKINLDAATEIGRIWQESNDEFLSGIERERKTITDKYNELIKKAKELNASQGFITDLEEKRDSSLARAMVVDWMEAFGELDKLSTEALVNIRDKLKQYIADFSKGLNKDELKDIVQTFEEIDRAISERKPATAFFESFSELTFQTNKLNALKSQLEVFKKQKAELIVIARLEQQIEQTEKDRATAAAKTNIALNEFGSQGGQIVGAIGEFTDMLENYGISIGESGENILTGVGQIIDAIGEIDITKPGSIISSVVKTLAGLGNVIAGIFGGSLTGEQISDSVFQKYDSMIAAMDEVIQKQKELLETMAGKAAVDASNAALAIIENQIKATKELGLAYLNSGAGWFSSSEGEKLRENLKGYKKDIEEIGISWDSIVGTGRMVGLYNLPASQLTLIKEELPQVWATIDEKTRGYLQSIIDAGDEVVEIGDRLNEQLTGLSFDAATDAFKDFLNETDSSMADVAENFEEYMRRAIISVVIDGTLQDRIRQWYDSFAEAMSDDILTEDEKERLKTFYESIYDTAIAERDAAYEAAGIDAPKNAPQGLAGAIKGITEETAGLIAGQFFAFRELQQKTVITGLEQLDSINRSAIFLEKIADNTKYNKHLEKLEQIGTDIASMNQKLN